jgi:ribosomal protein S14
MRTESLGKRSDDSILTMKKICKECGKLMVVRGYLGLCVPCLRVLAKKLWALTGGNPPLFLCKPGEG